ncbi:MAG: hypothetical protein ACYC8T_39055 [Myxococcaceae bacterium]
MAYMCPKCGGALARASGSAARYGGGLVGVMLQAAFAGLTCAKCGDISKNELSSDDRSTMMRNSALLVVGAVVLFVAVIGLVIGINS